MKTIFRVGVVFVMISCILSCATYQRIKIGRVLPRESFVKLQKLLTVSFCDKSKKLCSSQKFASAASGVVVKRNSKGAFILTAEHVCSNKFLERFRGKPYLLGFNALDIRGNKHSVTVVNTNQQHDLCLLWSRNFLAPAAPISEYPSEIGDKVYNLAAPAGIANKSMIPIFEGYNSGPFGDSIAYSIPATGGSSGSPIFNKNGQIVGMIHSAFTRFPMLSLSARHDVLKQFIESTILEYEKRLFFNDVLNLLETMNTLFSC